MVEIQDELTVVRKMQQRAKAQTQIAIIDRPSGPEIPLLEQFAQQRGAQRLQANEFNNIDPDTEVLFVRGGFWNDVYALPALTPKLKWIHVSMAGLDHLDTEFLRQNGIALTNSKGVLDRGIAEFVLGAVLLWSKGLHTSFRETAAGVWNPREPFLNGSLKTLILGTGGIGTHCAELLCAAGFGPIVGLRNSEKPLPEAFSARLKTADLENEIGQFDVIICCLPGTPETEGLLSAEILSRLQQNVVFVNVGRGVVVDHFALAGAMSVRPNALSVLDVTEPEPLPPAHPLRECANVVLSPHMSGETVERHEAFTSLFIDNLRRYEQRMPLRNVVVPFPE